VKINRRFTRSGASPYQGITFEKRLSEIRNPDGKVIFRQEDVQVPSFWSQIATDIMAQKYFRKTGVPHKIDKSGGETDARQVFHRLAFTWTDWGKRYGYFDTEDDAQSFYDELRCMLARQMAAPNSPQWFNTGLYAVYGIKGPAQGHHYVDPDSGELKQAQSAYERPQPHACQPYDAPVSTPNGSIPIGHIVEKGLTGIEVYDGTENGKGTTRIIAVAENGVKPVFRVELKNGSTLEATGDHLVFASAERRTPGDWLRVDELEPGMRLRLSTTTTTWDSEKPEPQLVDEAALVGWLHGDGFVGEYNSGSNRSLIIEFITVNEQEHQFILERIERVFPGTHYRVRDVESENGNLDIKRIRLYGEPLRWFVSRYSLIYESDERAVPDRIREGGTAVQAAYLRSLFQADGSVRLRRRQSRTSDVVLFNSSPGLIRDVLSLLLILGIYARVHAGRERRANRRTPYQLSIGYAQARRSFQQLVGFISDDKQAKLGIACSDVFPGENLPPVREEPVKRIEFLGLMKVYDIQTESGQYLSNNILVHNCFIISVEDDLVNPGGIMDLVTSEARLFKYGSGTGTNYSRLRAKQEPLSGGGISSGLLSFLRVGDRSASAIKSGGTTRRAARMVTLDADHPDITEYINWKVAEEQKVVSMVIGSKVLKRHTRLIEKAVSAAGTGGTENQDQSESTEKRKPDKRAFDPQSNPRLQEAIRAALREEIPPAYIYRILQLLAQGVRGLEIEEYTTEWDEEAYNTVSGQSSNNSVRLTSEFMEAVIEDGPWVLTGRVDRSLRIETEARKIWDQIAYAAWNCADPGIQFHSTINEWHTCPAAGEIKASNPCSEYMFLDDTACNLASLNLMTFYDTETGRFDVEALLHAIHIWTIVLEISVLMAQFPTAEIARRSYLFRTLGLGYANLGSLLMVMGIPYDSEEGRGVAACLTALLSGQAYLSSAQMAEQLGAFPRFEANREPMLRVIRNHRRAIYSAAEPEYEGLTVFPKTLDPQSCPTELLEAARRVWDQALEMGERHGFRNAQVSAIAPTGTIGLVMDCDTTGVEPDFALVKFKKLAGGGYFKIINTSIPPALNKLGYEKQQVEEITAYCVGRGTLKSSPGISWKELKAKGFTDAVLKRIDKSLASAFSIHSAFVPSVVGEELLEKKLGLDPETYNKPGFQLLRHLGFSAEQIEQADRYACGTMTVEGAPHLQKEHYPVFDTASRVGRIGTRFIPWQAHIEMMAAVQPFVSGAISKTVNMPNTVSVEEVKGAYFLSWKRMLKAIAIYRDGSKLSQPLSSLSSTGERLAEQILALQRRARWSADRLYADQPRAEPPKEPPDASRPAASQPAAGAPSRAPDRLTAAEPAAPRHNRRPLPSRRNGYTQKAKIGGHSLFLRTGEYPDGSLGEIFLDMHREGAAFRSLLNSFAIAVSLGLQYGVPLEEYVDAFVFTRFEPNGIVQGHDNIKITTSVLDFIFRDLALAYLKRTDLVQVKPDDLIATTTNGARESDEEDETGENGSDNSEKHYAKQQRVDSADQLSAGGNGGSAGSKPDSVPATAGSRRGDSRSPEGSEDGEALQNAKTAEAAAAAARDSVARAWESARMQGYEGDPCPVCGHLTLVRNGTCLKCLTCGSTTGCS
jgi:ribonucleoside-diphosphate reductase alpha chain